MTKAKWMQQFMANRETLVDFVLNWHPHSVLRGREKVDLPITAPSAEVSRLQIEGEGADTRPAATMARAIMVDDVYTLNNLLNDAYFAVPESTGCWQIRGFSEAVALMEDPPEDDESEERR